MNNQDFNNPYSNQVNNTIQLYNPNDPWYQNLTYFKNPIFFQNNTNLIYYYDFSKNTWTGVQNNSGQFFPIYHRATELPDDSFLISGNDAC